MNQYFIKVVAKTDKGKFRPNNEDSFVVCTIPCEFGEHRSEFACRIPPKGTILVVADGMGGAKAGEIASQIATQSIQHQFQELTFLPEGEDEIAAFLKNTVFHAHEEVVAYSEAHKQWKGMGTTIVLAWVLEGVLYVVWCGDSRCYLIQNEATMTQITEDHSKVWQMVKKGELTPEEARTHKESHIITQALGDKKLPPLIDFQMMPLAAQNKILLCSDGLNSMLADMDIAQIIGSEGQSLSETVNLLITKANEAGGLDNITVVLAEIRAE